MNVDQYEELLTGLSLEENRDPRYTYQGSDLQYYQTVLKVRKAIDDFAAHLDRKVLVTFFYDLLNKGLIREYSIYDRWISVAYLNNRVITYDI